RYSRINSDVLKPSAGSLPGLTTSQAIPGRNWGGNWVHTFSPSLQLQALFSRTTVSDNSLTKFKTALTSVIQAAGFAPGFASNFSGAKGWLLPNYELRNGYVSGGERDVDERTRLGGLFSAFFQDSWKASSKLTVNYGIRYDLTLIPPYGTKETIDKSGGIETGDFDFSNGTYVLQYPPPPCTVRGHA